MPAGSLVIRLDGVPSAEHDGVAISFPTRHAEAALRMIAAAGPQGIPAADIASVLWPDADPRRMGSRFRTMLWQTRRSLGPHAWRLSRAKDHVRFDTDGVVVHGRLDRNSIETQFSLSGRA